MIIAMIKHYFWPGCKKLTDSPVLSYVSHLMNAITSQIGFASAYRQLRPAQKAYVDAFVADAERETQKRGERISNLLYRAIPDNIVEQSRGMLDSPIVRAAITERINDLAAASELSVARVIKELMGISFASVGDYMEIGEDGQPYFDLSKATPEQLAAIKSIEVEEIGDGLSRPKKRKFKFALHDKLAGIKMLMDYTGASNPDNPFYRAEMASPIANKAALPVGISSEGAADLYASMINA
jgi:hypothetical protein